MRLEINGNGIPTVCNLPDGYELMFIGRYAGQYDNKFPREGFAVVIARQEALERGDYELYENASVGYCGVLGGEIELYAACHSHKYPEGGGMAEFLKPRSCQEETPAILWYPPGHKYKSSIGFSVQSVNFEEEWFFK
jgi:hypothetical protein